jgi:hypothetical protein
MKTPWLVCGLIALSAVAYSQKRIVNCTGEKPAPQCQTIFRDNYPYTVISDGPVRLVAGPIEYFNKRTFYRWIAAGNAGDALMDLSLRRFTSAFQDGKTAPAADPEKLLKSAQRHATFRNILQGAMETAVVGDYPVVVTDPIGNGSTVSYAYGSAELGQDIRQGNIEDSFQSLYNSALQHNSLQKGEKLTGVVYFEIPKGSSKNDSLTSTTLTIADADYIF